VEQWLFSQALQKKVKLRLTATALRCALETAT